MPTPQGSVQTEYLTSEEVAEKLSVSVRTLYRYIRAGKIPYYKVVGRYRFKPEDIQRWLDRQYHSPAMVAEARRRERQRGGTP